MVVEVFTLYELVHNRIVAFRNEYVDRCLRDAILFRGEQVHVNGPFCMTFFDMVRTASMSTTRSFRHIHYSVSPNSEISTEVELAWGIMSFMPLLASVISNPPDVLILSTDPISAKYLEYTRNKLQDMVMSLRQSCVTILENLPVVQLSATHQIHPTSPP